MAQIKNYQIKFKLMITQEIYSHCMAITRENMSTGQLKTAAGFYREVFDKT